ncbi:MAG TPA: tyrosine decarboxylase MfnA [Candidatus Thermoplasmatota archaeon]|nr:tyrosine decarboxylase MfnA [Candidatus Thermoplasmatota archaeon]
MSPKDSQKREKILKELDALQGRDFSFSSGHILGSMCTQPHPIVKEAYLRFLETNLGDPELCPGTKEIESRYLSYVASLLHAPKTFGGQIVSGGTEGNITAMWIARKLSRKCEIVLPESAHFSFQKIASLMSMKLKSVSLTNDYTMDLRAMKKKIGKNTVAVVGIAGSTELGTIDPIPDISDHCYDEHLFFHVDAAFGGFIIPFLKELHYDIPAFDFRLKGVNTISIDAHKMGYAAIPLGTLIVRKKQWLETISVASPYISSERQSGILGTRSGAPVAAAYAVARFLGHTGYRAMVKSCMDMTKYTQERITQLGLTLVIQPTMNVLGVRLKNPGRIVKRLSEHGWRVNKVERLSCIRLVLMPQITKQIIDEFIPVLKKICKEEGEL